MPLPPPPPRTMHGRQWHFSATRPIDDEYLSPTSYALDEEHYENPMMCGFTLWINTVSPTYDGRRVTKAECKQSTRE
uniref:Uncharacterized protein n=1 Tax=Oryza sativa subsp. japonica TaxID=39947 RepID=Q6ZB29_ORYSJ|nr:hypothetical protein [Oryza sativa Japonica Group]BAD05378.1 hypothetical protein [Oryza sativa Japonica Group]